MKFSLATMFAVFCWSATVFGQNLEGTWQGTLTMPADQLRLIVKITKGPDGKFVGQFFSIDRNTQPRPVNAISQDGRSVKFKVDAIDASFEGAFASDGSAINGTLTQANNPLRFNLARATPETAWVIPEPPASPQAMDATADPGIEVASIRLSPPGAQGRSLGVRGATLVGSNQSVLDMIIFSYDLHERQVSGVAPWMSTDRFQFEIKPDTPGQPNSTQVRRLIQKLLAERFQLKFHKEERELSVYAIKELANTRHKLTASVSGRNLPTLRFPRRGFLPAQNATITELGYALQRSVLDRPVVNQTKIEGRYDFTLDWTPDQFQFGGAGATAQLPDNGKPNIYQAFQEQLGLKLEATKALAGVMVIDRVEKPSEN